MLQESLEMIWAVPLARCCIAAWGGARLSSARETLGAVRLTAALYIVEETLSTYAIEGDHHEGNDQHADVDSSSRSIERTLQTHGVCAGFEDMTKNLSHCATNEPSQRRKVMPLRREL